MWSTSGRRHLSACLCRVPAILSCPKQFLLSLGIICLVGIFCFSETMSGRGIWVGQVKQCVSNQSSFPKATMEVLKIWEEECHPMAGDSMSGCATCDEKGEYWRAPSAEPVRWISQAGLLKQAGSWIWEIPKYTLNAYSGEIKPRRLNPSQLFSKTYMIKISHYGQVLCFR